MALGTRGGRGSSRVCEGLSDGGGSPAGARRPGGAARFWVSHPTPPGPGSCQPMAVRGPSSRGWWEGGGLNAVLLRTAPRHSGCSGRKCLLLLLQLSPQPFPCSLGSHSWQMQSWALSPGHRASPRPATLSYLSPSPHSPDYCSPKSALPGTQLPTGGPWGQQGPLQQLFPQSRIAGLSIGRAVFKITELLRNPLYFGHLKTLFQEEVHGTQQVKKPC